MFKPLLRSLAVIAALAAGGTAIASPAAADGVHFGVTIGDRNDHRAAGHDFGRHHRRPALCTAGQAVRKASRFGVRHAHVQRVNRRSILVGGRSRHGHARVRFARAPGCPVIAFHR